VNKIYEIKMKREVDIIFLPLISVPTFWAHID